MVRKVEKAEYVNDYKIKLIFDDGVSGTVDLKNEIWGEIFEPLKDIHYFKNFHVDTWTIYWDCGADFAPEFLYKMVKEQEGNLVK
ncbi:DUF2442 domain-containing protein [Marivirga sp.]|uniref:DUF2442 domain-containing protein n=1 Tax=Marivirga sp. TaxID=2018662 RepID=UPI0025DAF1CF|nr:DUF2442 domain-containing protein [Marivirga sp.]